MRISDLSKIPQGFKVEIVAKDNGLLITVSSPPSASAPHGTFDKIEIAEDVFITVKPAVQDEMIKNAFDALIHNIKIADQFGKPIVKEEELEKIKQIRNGEGEE